MTLKNVHNRKVIQRATKKEVDQVVEEFIQYAKDNGFKMSELGEK